MTGIESVFGLNNKPYDYSSSFRSTNSTSSIMDPLNESQPVPSFDVESANKAIVCFLLNNLVTLDFSNKLVEDFKNNSSKFLIYAKYPDFETNLKKSVCQNLTILRDKYKEFIQDKSSFEKDLFTKRLHVSHLCSEKNQGPNDVNRPIEACDIINFKIDDIDLDEVHYINRIGLMAYVFRYVIKSYQQEQDDSTLDFKDLAPYDLNEKMLSQEQSDFFEFIKQMALILCCRT